MALFSVFFLVFTLYKCLVDSVEVTDGVIASGLTSEHLRDEHESETREQIRLLETRLHELEQRLHDMERVSPKEYIKVKKLPFKDRKRILVTGGAGFVGSHLVDRLMKDGHEVTVADNFFTGRKSNIEHWVGHPSFELIHHDIVNPLFIEVDMIYHLASPASPPHYMFNPVKTIKTNTVGTINMLGLARRVGARILIASTSEVYGDPEIHPQVIVTPTCEMRARS